jgi:hypothetical protein
MDTQKPPSPLHSEIFSEKKYTIALRLLVLLLLSLLFSLYIFFLFSEKLEKRIRGCTKEEYIFF